MSAGYGGLDGSHPDDAVVTGEAVVLDVRPASVLSRALAFALDAVVQLSLLVPLVSVLTWAAATMDPAAAAALGVAGVVAWLVGLPTTVETLTRGRSLGKLAAGLMIVRDDGGPVGFRHALLRALLAVVEIWLTTGSLALLTAILNPRGKRLGDIAAGTVCVRVRGGEPPAPPLVMPPELAVWAAAADIRALPDGVALRARRFLARAPGLHIRSRETLGRELASRIEPLVAPPPPWGTPAERFLEAVLVARRDREFRLARAAKAETDLEATRLRRLPYGVGWHDRPVRAGRRAQGPRQEGG